MRLLLLALLLAAAAPAAAESLDPLRRAVAREVSDPARAMRAEAMVDELRQLFAEASAGGKADAAQLVRMVDIYQRMKTVVTADEWERLPRLLAAPYAAAQELLGFMQTYDATAGDLEPVLRRLRAEAAR